MIESQISDKGILFSGYINNQPLHFNEWPYSDDCIYYFPLAILVDNGSAEYKGNECFVPFESIYQIEENDRLILGLPKNYPYNISLRSEGTFNESSFKYTIDFHICGPDSDIIIAKRCGNILTTSKDKYLLNESQFEVCCMVDEFNSLPESEKDFQSNLLTFDKIKKKAISANCHLDSYLEGETVYSPTTIKIECDKENDVFTIKPSLDISENEHFQKTFERQRRALDIYPVQNDRGDRTRIVLSKRQKEGLSALKQRGTRSSSRDDFKELIEKPTEYFDPEIFDLSFFYSERVIEIGLYKPKFYSFVCPYKSCWITAASIESPSEGTTKIAISTMEDLNNLDMAIAEAECENRATIIYEGCHIDIEDARSLRDLATKQLSSPDKAITKHQGKEVLIIEENAESLGFIVEAHKIEQSCKYTLYLNKRLDERYSLKPHQEEGIAWLQYLFSRKAPGCLLADDMGLGKTLQILYFIDWHSQKKPKHRPYLIVAPISLLENWNNEFKKFFPLSNLRTSILTSKQIPRHFDKTCVEKLQHQDIIFTNYESLRNSQLNFCAIDYDIIVLDEAQKIKTPGTMVTNAAKALKGSFKIAMTGTPVENTLVDLWCIMDFCVPGLLGNAKNFASKYQHPLKNSDTDIIALGNEIHDKLGIYMMRRMKANVAKDLPAKHEIKKCIEMPKLQRDTYISSLNRFHTGIQPNILATILEIREISEHPYLYDHTLNSRTRKEIEINSARVIATLDFLDNIYDKNEKAIIFAERKESQRMLQELLHARYHINAKIINGDTPTMNQHRAGKQSRQSAIDEYQAKIGFNVIIMSPIAAGMGLNVTAASHVIHFSRSWNPAKENQATDRAYRIGQVNDVYVYYPMSISESFHSFDLTKTFTICCTISDFSLVDQAYAFQVGLA